MYFHQYIVQIKNTSHWYEVKGIDYINQSIIIIYKNMIRVVPFYDIVKVKELGTIKEVKV